MTRSERVFLNLGKVFILFVFTIVPHFILWTAVLGLGVWYLGLIEMWLGALALDGIVERLWPTKPKP